MYKILIAYIQTSRDWCWDRQVIDNTDDLGHARYMVKEYQFIYGKYYKVWYERSK